MNIEAQVGYTFTVATDDDRVRLVATLEPQLVNDRTVGILVQCVSDLAEKRPAKAGKACTGLHCKCMDRETCPEPHHGDHDCPYE